MTMHSIIANNNTKITIMIPIVDWDQKNTACDISVGRLNLILCIYFRRANENATVYEPNHIRI